nr:hypothetical protein [Coralloluteibacterium stylophorae]
MKAERVRGVHEASIQAAGISRSPSAVTPPRRTSSPKASSERGVIAIWLPPKWMPCGSRSQALIAKPSSGPSQSCASARVERPPTRARIAESRWLEPVEYSIVPPGSSTKGCASAARTQSSLATQRP